jgi:DNA-binding transcriptional ArsR family regulator
MKPKVENWIRQLQNGVIESKTVKILHEVYNRTNKHQPCNVYHLRNHFSYPHQTLTAILSSLQDEGMVDMYGETEIEGNKYQKIRYTHPDERQHLAQKRQMEKLKQWINKAECFDDLLNDELKQGIQNAKKQFDEFW